MSTKRSDAVTLIQPSASNEPPTSTDHVESGVSIPGAPQNAPGCTISPANGLSSRQEQAIELMLTGMRDAAVAEQLGISRWTVTRWRLHQPEFIAELNRRRQETWQSATDRVQRLMDKALNQIEIDLDSYSRQSEAAWKLMRIAGKIHCGKPKGPTDSDEILREFIKIGTVLFPADVFPTNVDDNRAPTD